MHEVQKQKEERLTMLASVGLSFFCLITAKQWSLFVRGATDRNASLHRKEA